MTGRVAAVIATLLAAAIISLVTSLFYCGCSPVREMPVENNWTWEPPLPKP